MTATGVRVSAGVEAALEARRPVVALESTIISHGLPRPRNLQVARELEAMLDQAGVTAATVGVVAGQPIIGLSPGEVEILATSPDVAKVGVRELPLLMAAGGHGATTVASTAVLARGAGIRVFATGGIGGVHRGAGQTFDESADLSTLGRTPITVVCAGVKSVLDVPATLERLETLGVTLVGFGTRAMPGFFVADSGFSLEWSVGTAAEVATIMRAADALFLESAIVVANPVPVEQQLEPAVHEALLTEAVEAAESNGIQGKAVTPFLLDHIYRASGGASLEANVSAVRNNVAVAAGIARAFAGPGE